MLLWTSHHIQKFNFIPQVFCETLQFKESCILRFLDHNSRTRFLQTCCFGKKYKKKNIGTSCWNKKACLNGWDFFPKNFILRTFKPSKPSPLNFFAKIGIRHFSYFMMRNFMEKKEKKLMIQRSCIPGKWEKEWSQIIRTLLLRCVPNLFFHHRDDIDFQLQYWVKLFVS